MFFEVIEDYSKIDDVSLTYWKQILSANPVASMTFFPLNFTKLKKESLCHFQSH